MRMHLVTRTLIAAVTRTTAPAYSRTWMLDVVVGPL